MKGARLRHLSPPRANLEVAFKPRQIHAFAVAEGRESTGISEDEAASIEIFRDSELGGTACVRHRDPGGNCRTNGRPKVCDIGATAAKENR